MRSLALSLTLALVAVGCVSAETTLADCAGVVRVFGDMSSWMSSCFVVGDGSWVITTCDSLSERIGPETNQTIRYPLFISAYTGLAYPCELKASNKDLSVAILKLSISGLPGASLGKMTDFAKAASGTLGQLSTGELVGNKWPTTIHGITLNRSAKPPKLGVSQWNADKVFVTDIGKHKWMFASSVSPSDPVPNGAMVARESIVVGMYVNKLVVTGGADTVVYGRCAMSPEIARFCGDSGIDTAALYDPPKPTIAKPRDADAAFQLQSRIYTQIGARRPAFALQPATALVAARPSDAQARMALGIAQLGAGKAEEALKSFDEAIKLDGKLPMLRANRALALVALKKTSEAETELAAAVSDAPNDPRPVVALAEFYLANEKTLDKALTYARKASNMASNSAAAQLLVGKVEKSRKKYQEAVSAIGEAVKMAPEWGEAWYALGATYEEGGDKANAEKAYRKLVEKQPTNPDSLFTLASFLGDTGKKDEALEMITKIKALSPPKETLKAVEELQAKIEGAKTGGAK